MSHVVLITLGSAGDVHPFAATGAALLRRGHRVTLLSNEHFAPLAARLGLEFFPIGTDADYQRIQRHPDLWHARRGLGVIWQALGDGVALVWDWIERHASTDMILVGSTLAFGARIAHDRLGLPLATVHLAPTTLMSARAPARMGSWGPPRFLPPAAVSVLWSLADHALLDPLLSPAVNGLRLRLGLAPVRHLLRHYIHSPQCVLLYYPDWFRPDPGDLPPNSQFIGFPRFDEQGLHPLSPDLQDFLHTGTRPLLFTPGSANIQAQRFFSHAIAACRHLGRRGLLVTSMPLGSLPAGLRQERYVPFSDVLGQVDAIVHHGGIGTCAQGLAAGVPQLVVPSAYDQFDNGERLLQLGVGDWLSGWRSERAFGRRLHHLVHNPACAAAARHWRQAVEPRETVLERACTAIEGLALA